MIQAGRLRHKIVLQSPAGSQDSLGERTTTWTDEATVHAEIRPLGSKEQFIAAQNHASTTHKIKLRYSSEVSGIDASWRVKYGTRIFTIDGMPINFDERNREINLPCTEGLREE